jgi:DNA repair protein RadC
MQTSPYMITDRDILTHHSQQPRKYVGRIKDLPENEKPRERLLKNGSEILSVSELLAVVFGTGTKKESVLEMTSRIVREYGDKGLAHERDPKKLSEELDIPLNKAMQIVACFSLGRRVFKSTGTNVFIRSAEDAFEYLADMRNLPKEQLRGLYLNSRYQLIHDEVISMGTLTSNVVHPREVFQPALQYAAAGIVIVHNHPSGDSSPTEADKEITEQLIQAGKILGIDILDHVVVTKDSYKSVQADYHV